MNRKIIEKSFKNYRRYSDYIEISQSLGQHKKAKENEKICKILWDKLTDLSNDENFIKI